MVQEELLEARCGVGKEIGEDMEQGQAEAFCPGGLC